MASRNVTLSLPEDLVRRAKVFAAERDTSMSAVVAELLTQAVQPSRSYEQSWQDEERYMASGHLRIGDGLVSRDELHRR